MSSTTPLSSILVANRGEIARRVFRTARSMGMHCVAVFVDADADAPFVTEADEAAEDEVAPDPAADGPVDDHRLVFVAVEGELDRVRVLPREADDRRGGAHLEAVDRDARAGGRRVESHVLVASVDDGAAARGHERDEYEGCESHETMRGEEPGSAGCGPEGVR